MTFQLLSVDLTSKHTQQIGNAMTADEYRTNVLPAVLPLFGVTDRAVRMQLLEVRILNELHVFSVLLTALKIML